MIEDMPGLKPIKIIPDDDKNAIWALWEYVANQENEVIFRYQEDIKKVAEILDVSDHDLYEYTGLQFDRDESLDY